MSQNSELVQFLNRYWSNPQSPAKLAADFQDRFAVKVAHEEPYYLFKYHHIDTDWRNPLTRECRGSILFWNKEASSWEFACRPFDKFWNLGESRCALNGRWREWWSELRIHEKADGTCINLWWDRFQSRWRVSTLGMIDGAPVYDTGHTFQELFNRVVQIDHTRLYSGNTYMFELCTRDNQIVTRYAKDCAYLLASRNNRLGKHMSLDALMDTYYSVCQSGVTLPSVVYPDEEGLYHLDDLRAWVNSLHLDTDAYWERYPEGAVVYYRGVPVAKVKTEVYMQARNVVGTNVRQTRNAIVEAVIHGTLDDIMPLLSDNQKRFAGDVLRRRIMDYGSILDAIKRLQMLSHSSQKEYALAVQRSAPKELRGFFFRYQADILRGVEGPWEPVIDEYVKAGERHFRKRWKEGT